jgi:hypothetical protein
MVLSIDFSIARGAEGHEILGRIIAQLPPWLNVMDLKILHATA